MKPVPLAFDFSDRVRSPRPIALALLLLSCALVAWQGLRFSQALSAARREAATFARLDPNDADAARPRAGASAKPDASELVRSHAIQRIADNLATPWADLLYALEEAPHKAAALISIEPSASKHSLRLTAEARNLHEMLVFVAALQKDERLGSVTLVSHQIQGQTPGAPVRFVVQAAWGGQR